MNCGKCGAGLYLPESQDVGLCLACQRDWRTIDEPAKREAVTPEVPPMVWTDAKPVKPGWYWHLYNGEPMPLKVVKKGGLMLIDSYRFSIDGMKGQWSSRPIDEPKESLK